MLKRPGSFLVGPCRSPSRHFDLDVTCALSGDLMVAQAEAAKLGGFVVDAASRDMASFGRGTFPIFAAGTNPCGDLVIRKVRALRGLFDFAAAIKRLSRCPAVRHRIDVPTSERPVTDK